MESGSQRREEAQMSVESSTETTRAAKTLEDHEATQNARAAAQMPGLSSTETTRVAKMLEDYEAATHTRAAVGLSVESPKSFTDGRPSLANRFADAVQTPATYPVETAAAQQLGPWDTGYFGFPSGVAVGGYSNLVLYSNGAYNCSGHFHVSGGISYDTSFVWAVRDSNVPAVVYTFAHTGRVHGTFEPGSRDDDWGKSEILPALAEGWPALWTHWNYHWEARVNADFSVFLDDIVKLVAAGTAIAKVVSVFI
jgi:hypothetical protein